MGGVFSRQKQTVVINGNSGMIPFIESIKQNFPQVTPQIGFSVQYIQIQGINLVPLVLPMGEKIKPLWKVYYECSPVILLYFDNDEPDLTSDFIEELEYYTNSDVKNEKPIIVFVKSPCEIIEDATELLHKFHLGNINARRVIIKHIHDFSFGEINAHFIWIIANYL